MSNVIDIIDRLRVKRQIEGDLQFMHCPCSDPEKEYAGFAPLAAFGNNGAFIVSLICNNCDSEYEVSGGILNAEE